MKLKFKFPTFFLCCLALSSSVFASYGRHSYKGEELLPPEPRGHFELLGAGGIANLDADNGSLGVTSSETDRLVQTNENTWNTASGQLGAGYVYYLPNYQTCPDHVRWFTAIEPELNVYYLASNSIEGNVLRFGSHAFNDLTFDIPVHSTRVMLDAALTVAAWRQYSIYGIIGLGDAWTRLSYSDKDKPSASDPCPEQNLRLKSNTRSAFAWEGGAGLIYALTNRVGISFEYLYVNLGKVRTSSSGNTGTITAPVIRPASFNLSSQTGMLGLHIGL